MERIKLISCNFGNNRQISLNNQNELAELNVDVKIYNDSNFPSRHLSLHPRLKSKIPKMLEWMNGDYDYYIWADSKFDLREGIIKLLIEKLGDNDIAFFKHPARSSIKSEFELVDSLVNENHYYINPRYSGEDMKGQIETYLADETFVDDKLFGAGCFIYKKSLVENKDYNLLKEWYFHNSLYSIQDQLSLPYLLHKFKTKYGVFDFSFHDNTSLIYHMGF